MRRVADECLAACLDALDHAGAHEAVHEVRRLLKQLRALLRLVGEAAPEVRRRENVALRDAGRLLAPLRDAGALVETVDLLAPDASAEVAEALADMRTELVARRDAAAQRDVDAAIAEARVAIEAARGRVGDWPAPRGWPGLRGGFAQTYARLRRTTDIALGDPDPERWHDWRKRAKDHRYQLDLLQDAFPQLMVARRDATHELTDHLGLDHDLWVLRDALTRDDGALAAKATPAVDDLVARRRDEHRRAAALLGRRLVVDDVDELAGRVGAWFELARDAASSAPALAAASACGTTARDRQRPGSG